MAAKEARLVIRMNDDLLEWIRAQADLRGLDAAAFVRSQMAQMRNGLLGAAPLSSAPAPVAQPPQRDVLDLSSPLAAQEPLEPEQAHEEATGDPEIDIDLDALAAAPRYEFEVARPGDTNAVRSFGPRADRSGLMNQFRRG